jgi:hypothetical protein
VPVPVQRTCMLDVDHGTDIGVSFFPFSFEVRLCSVDAPNVLVLPCTVMSRVMDFTLFFLV